MTSRPPHDDSQAVLLAGRYALGRVLGQGGMGEVRAGTDRRLGRDVAIKVLRSDLAAQPVIRLRFDEEARSAARLVHPHVVTVLDAGEDGGIAFLVMERLSGRTLAQEIATAPLTVQAAQAMGVQMLDALAASHAAGLVHRDIKPGNILEAGPGVWKVGDFGIAKSVEVSDQNLTVSGLILGTPAYLAPERLAGGPATVSSDLYAAGVVLYEALSGHRPVASGAALEALLTATPVPLNDLRPDVPAPLVLVIARAMARDPASRFLSAADMAAALRASMDVAQPRQSQAPTSGITEGLAPETVVLPDASPHAAPETVVLSAAAPVTVAEGVLSPQADPNAVDLPAAPSPDAPFPNPPVPGAPRASRPVRRHPGVGVIAGAALLLAVIISVVGARGHGASVPASTPPSVAPSSAAPAGGPAPAGSIPAPLESSLQDLARQVQP